MIQKTQQINVYTCIIFQLEIKAKAFFLFSSVAKFFFSYLKVIIGAFMYYFLADIIG